MYNILIKHMEGNAMKHRIMLLSALVPAVICASAYADCDDGFPSPAAAYKARIDHEENAAGFCLFDVTGDGSDELILKTGTGEDDYRLSIYTYSGRSAKLLKNMDGRNAKLYDGQGFYVVRNNGSAATATRYYSVGNHFMEDIVYDGSRRTQKTIDELVEYWEPLELHPVTDTEYLNTAIALPDKHYVLIDLNGEVLGGHGYIVDDRTLVPVRSVFDAMGFDVDWDDISRTATLTSEAYTIVLGADKTDFTVNGTTVTPDVPQTVIYDRLYLPLRAISEAVGAEVSWDGTMNTAYIALNAEALKTKYPLPQSSEGMIDALIDEVDADAGVVYLKSAQNGAEKLMLNDKSEIYSSLGTRLAAEELYKDAVISIAYDTKGGFDDSGWYKLYVSGNEIEGMVSGIDESGDIPVIITEDGERHESLFSQMFDFDAKDNATYSFYTDIFGRIMNIECLGPDVVEPRYGIITAIEEENGKYFALIDDENGRGRLPLETRLTAVRASQLLFTDDVPQNDIVTPETEYLWKTPVYAWDVRLSGSMAELGKRIVVYSVNKKGEITDIGEPYPMLFVPVTSDPYIKTSNKLGEVILDGSTVIDLRDYEKSGEYKLIDAAQLADGRTYKYVHVYGKKVFFIVGEE